MNANRTHANRPQALTARERARLSHIPATPNPYGIAGAAMEYWVALGFALTLAIGSLI